MFKIGLLKDITDIKTEISILDSEVKDYKNNLHYHYNSLDFCVCGKNDDTEYSLCFRLNKQPMEKLADIELNTSVLIDEFIDEFDIQLGVNGIFDLDVKIFGKIYRIISNTIIISGYFVSSEDEVGKFEIEFNLDDYINKNEKSDV